MLRILILGGSGMLGHQLWRHFSQRNEETYATIRKRRGDYRHRGLFDNPQVIESIDARCFEDLEKALTPLRPDVVFNCIGVTKRREKEHGIIDSIVLNALLPHQLALWGRSVDARIVNFSTDCVFDGSQWNYREDSLTNATDLYGRTKALGEVFDGNVLTIRSSFIGPELQNGTELFEWFVSQRGAVEGFRGAIYTGLTTLELGRIVEFLVFDHPDAHGLYQISSDPVTKYELLNLIRKGLRLNVEVSPDDTFKCNRSLDSGKFRKEFRYSPPTWQAMVDELVEDYKRVK